MGKEKKKPVWRKSYIKIITEKKEAQDTGELAQCQYCGASIEGAAVYCPYCGRVREAET
jgi:rubrerythrin